MTLENQCLLANRCKKAGQEEFCNPLCFAYRKFHGESGSRGIYGLAGIPSAYMKARADNLPFKKDNPEAYVIVTRYCSKILQNVDEGIGFYFYSIPNELNRKGTGTGKTTAAISILNEFLVERMIQHVKKERMIEDFPALFVNVSKFQNTFNSQFRGTKEMQEEASAKYYRFKERMMKVDLLVLDDIGIRDATESFMNEFYEIVDERAIEQRATIFTSNVPINQLAETLDDRIASRIEGSTIQVSFVGEDKRKRGVF
ncbi:ATP-binding protein [Fredinandcohnia humi]